MHAYYHTYYTEHQSSNNNYSIATNIPLNSYSGKDKLDNSKRLTYGIRVNNDNINLELSQNYEFTDNSNYHIETGHTNNLSDLLGVASYTSDKFSTN